MLDLVLFAILKIVGVIFVIGIETFVLIGLVRILNENRTR